MRKIKILEPLLLLSILFVLAIILRISYQGVFYLNAGFLGGELSDLPHTLRFGFHIGYVVGGGVLYIFFFRQISDFSNTTRIAIHLIVASLFSNFLEKFFFDNVFDFIHLYGLGYYCNIADIGFALSGLFLTSKLIKTILLEKNDNDKRQAVFASYKIQKKLFLVISLVLFGFFLSVITLLNIVHHDSKSLTIVIGSYFFLSECILFCLLASMTNKIIGPIESFLRYGLSQERVDIFSIRKNDYFKELEVIAKELAHKNKLLNTGIIIKKKWK